MIGKVPMLIKSLTHPNRILSIRLPNKPARKITAIRGLTKRFCRNRTKIANTHILIMITSIIGTGSDRAIPVLKCGSNHTDKEPNLRSYKAYLVSISNTTKSINTAI